MKITYLGHASFQLEINNKLFLVDPFMTGNPLISNFDINAQKADYILVTHAHQDHILDVETVAKNTGATIISNYEIVMHYLSKELKGHPMNHGGSVTFEEVKIKYVNAIHTSSFPDGSYGGQPGGFVLTFEDKSIYIAGDTALTFDMKLIPMFNSIDLAILPIGDNFTMDVQEAIIASDFVECDEILACHYDTFEMIKVDKKMAKQAFSSKGKTLLLPNIFESINI